MFKANSMDEIFRHICTDLTTEGVQVKNTHEFTNYGFELTDINNNVINIRNISKSYLFGELTWYLAQRNDLEFISKFSTFWNHICDDGKTCYSAYGDVVFKRHGFDQVQTIINLLKADPESRRAVINFNVPKQDIITTKDEICTIALVFNIRDNKLNCTCIMRSNDIWTGLPYDVVFFTELQKHIAHALNIEYGTYTHFVASIHVYDKNFDAAVESISRPVESHIRIDIEKLFKHVHEIEKKIEKSKSPRTDIIKLFDKYGIYWED